MLTKVHFSGNVGGSYPILGDPNYPDKTIPDSIRDTNNDIVYCIKEFIYKQDNYKDQLLFKENKQYKLIGSLVTGIGLICEPISYIRNNDKEILYYMFVQIDFFNEHFAPVSKMRKLKMKKLNENKSS